MPFSWPTQPSKTVIVMSGLGALITALLLSDLAPRFSLIYSDLGANLPVFTQLLLQYYYLIWLLPILVFVVLLWPKPQQRAPIMLTIAWIALPIGWFLLYLPLFNMRAQ